MSRKIALFCIFAFSFLFWHILFSYAPTDNGNVFEIEATIPKGIRTELYVNGSGECLSAIRLTDQRTTYRFVGLPNAIHHLRFDLTDQPEVETKIFSARALQDGVPIKTWSARDLASVLAVDSSTPVTLVDETVVTTSTTNDPKLFLSQDFVFQRSLMFGPIGEWIVQHFPFCLSIVAAILLLLLSSKGRRDFSIVFGITVALCSFGMWLATRIRLPALYGPVSEAVGQTSYLGYPKGTEFILYWLAVGFSMIAGILGGIIGSRFVHDPTESYSVNGKEENKSRWFLVVDCIFILCLWLFIVVPSFPYLSNSLKTVSNLDAQLDYDSLNVFSWSAFSLFGWKAFRDYWFPYGGFSDLLYGVPFNLWREHIHLSLIWLAIIVTLFILYRRSLIWTSLTVLLLLFFNHHGLLAGMDRYFMGATLILGYVAALFVLRSRTAAVICGLYMAYVMSMELFQALYVGVAVVILSTAILVFQSEYRKNFLVLLGYLGVTVLSGATVWVYLLYKDWQIEEFIQFCLRAGSIAVCAAVGSNIREWFGGKLSLESVLFLSTLFLTSTAFAMVIAFRKSRYLPILSTVLGVASFGVVIFLKQMVRPHMANQIIALQAVGWSFVIYVFSKGWNKWQQLIFAFYLGAVASYAGVVGTGIVDLAMGMKRIGNIGEDIRVGLEGESRWRNNELSLLDPSRFAKHYPLVDPLMSFIDEFKSLQGRPPKVYVLGDDAYVYLMLKQKPPKFITLYNSSDLRDQIDIVRWIATEDPDVVIWNTQFTSFDAVPNWIRVPLVYQYIVKRYEFSKKLAGYDLLIHKPIDHLTDISYWNKNLGSLIDLGGIPLASQLGTLRSCDQNFQADCLPVLQVKLSNTPTDRHTEEVAFSHADDKIAVRFATEPGMRTYYLNPDRFWFWNARSTHDWTTQCSGPAGSLCKQVRLIPKYFPHPILY